MSKEEFTTEDSIAGVAAAITLNYDMLLEILQEHIKDEYVGAVADVNPGATAYLDEEAVGIWDAAMKVVLDHYLATLRPNADDPAQVQTAAQAMLQGLRFVYDADDVPFDTDEGMSDYLAREVLKALAKGGA